VSDDQDIDQLQDDIEQTRGDLAETIGQIEARLRPSALQDQVSDIVKQVSDQLMSEFEGKSGELTSKINEQVQVAFQGVATDRVEKLVAQAGPAVGVMGKSMWARLSDNPAVGALAAVGIGLLAAEETARRSGAIEALMGSSQGGSPATGTVGSVASGLPAKASDLAKEAADAISGGVDAAKQQAQGIAADASSTGSGGGSSEGGLGAILSDPSLASGLLGMGIGFLVGLVAPETSTEREAISPLKEKAAGQLDKLGAAMGADSGQGLLDQAKQAGSDLLDQAAQSASWAVESGKQAAGQAKETVLETAKQASSGNGSSNA